MGVEGVGMVESVVVGEEGFEGDELVEKGREKVWEVVESEIGCLDIGIGVFCKSWGKGVE